MSTKPYEELRKKMKPEARAAAEKLGRQFLAEIRLKELRQAKQLSQVQVASKLKMKQASVSKLERQADMYVSSLRQYVKAIGGELIIAARFPDGDVNISQFSKRSRRRSRVSARVAL